MTAVPLARFATRFVILLAALLVVGCGEGEPLDESVRQAGRLVVEKSLAKGPIFIEGSVTKLRVVDGDGQQIVNGLRRIDTLDVPLFDRAVPEGSYQVTAVERPCEGNCDFLDPPVEATRCEVAVDVRANRTTRVAIVLSSAAGKPDSDCSGAAGR